MAKKKETEEVVADFLETRMPTIQKPDEQAVIIDVLDFNELATLENTAKQIGAQLNQLSGNVYRLIKDQEALFAHEKALGDQLNMKRKELIKRYKIDDQKAWQIDANTRHVLYPK